MKKHNSWNYLLETSIQRGLYPYPISEPCEYPLLQRKWSRSGVSDSLQPRGLQPTRLLCPWIFQARVLEWIAISFSRGSSQPRDWTRVSRIVDRRFTIWATREVLEVYRGSKKNKGRNSRPSWIGHSQLPDVMGCSSLSQWVSQTQNTQATTHDLYALPTTH